MAKSDSKRNILKMAVGEVILKDAGHKMEKGIDCGPVPMKKDKKWYPCLYLSTEDVPALEGRDAGTEVTIVARAFIKGHSLNDNGDKKRENFDLELRSIGIVGPKEPKEDD